MAWLHVVLLALVAAARIRLMECSYATPHNTACSTLGTGHLMHERRRMWTGWRQPSQTAGLHIQVSRHVMLHAAPMIDHCATCSFAIPVLLDKNKFSMDAGADAPDRRTKRVRIVVIGSGWGAMSLIKAMRKEDSEVGSPTCPLCCWSSWTFTAQEYPTSPMSLMCAEI